MSRRSLLYGAALLGLLAAFAVLCWEAARSAALESDMSWMVPSVFHGTEGKPWSEVIRFLLFGISVKLQVLMKLYLFVGMVLLKGYVRDLVLFAAVVHLASAVLVYGIGCLLDLGRRASALSAMVYLSLFTHFHAYLWPTASAYHLFSAFFILLIFFLYLETERRIARGRSWRGLFWTAVLISGFSSVNRSPLIGPLLIFAHLVLEKPPELRPTAFRRWLPLFLFCLLAPAVWLALVPEWHSNTVVRLALRGLEHLPLPAVAKVLALWGIGALFLLAVDRILRASTRGGRWRTALRWAPLGMSAAGVLLLVSLDRRQILLPYNALTPFAMTLISFLQPLRAAMASDSSYPFYLIRPEMEVSDLLLAIALIGLFVASGAGRRRPWRLLAVWTAATLFHFLFQFSSQPVMAPSRHFIYLSPVFCFSLCSVLGWLISVFPGPRRRQGWEILLVGAVAALCFENLLAIHLVSWRGRLVNNFYTYDDIRTARLIQEHLRGKGEGALNSGGPAVSGVVSMPFGRGSWYFMEADPEEHWTFRLVWREIFQDPFVRELNSGRGSLYRVFGERVTDAEGRRVDPFHRFFDRALLALSSGNRGESGRLFEQAVLERPFLLRFLLPRECRLEDLRWLTGGLDVRSWLVRARDVWAPRGLENPKHRQVWKVLDGDLLDYEACLLFLSYLEHQQGREESSRSWLAQLHYLESGPEALVLNGSRHPAIRRDPAVLEFVESLRHKTSVGDPLPWWKDDYGFGRFLARFLLRWDIASSWDKRLN